ncbi:hypothetical protein [Sphingomonas sp.]|jgi:hypothetical protein|uniref:hypothetical protein n=1 Tax=Sphingomonas sp. TaxID=28214 RepID=UPI002D7FF356|nr:hypothetical protein [Sphingomonas sp.]HEU0045780.1 hypothetical protein [Sphingomonas sp.]
MSDNDFNRTTAGALDGRDDPNRGPLDRAANVVTGGSGGVGGAMHHDDPNRGPLDRTANALDGHDDQSRGIFDRTENAVSGGTAGSSYGATGSGRVISAAFDSQDEAERAVAELRQAGVGTGSLSIIARNRGTTTARDGGGEVTDEHHSNVLRGILGGGALGAGLGVAALAIPGVGPLVAAGAIAASAVPEAIAIGAAVGAAAGTFNEVLLKHGIDEEDVSYYGDQMKRGGVLVTVSPGAGVDASRARDILSRNGGHTASQARVTTA